MRDAAVVEIVRRHAVRVDLETAGQRLLEAIDPRVSLVLIGEATHGTHEFYRIRADLTRALIQHRGFTCVAAEADWPDAYRANRWVRLLGDDQYRGRGARRFHPVSAVDVAEPRSRAVPALAARARMRSGRPDRASASTAWICTACIDRWRASSSTSDKVDPTAARRARRGYACFDVFGDDVQRYGYAASLDLATLVRGRSRRAARRAAAAGGGYAKRDGRIAADEYFVAEQNARVVCDAEAYYRAMFRGGAGSWNLRDRHMMATLEALLEHASRRHRPARPSSGRTTPISAMRAPPAWPTWRAESRPARARALWRLRAARSA